MVFFRLYLAMILIMATVQKGGSFLMARRSFARIGIVSAAANRKDKSSRRTEKTLTPPTEKNTISEREAGKEQELPLARSFAKKTVWGQNIINCRKFSLDSPKKFSFLGSYTSTNAAPIYPIPEIAFIGRSNVGKSSLLNCLTGGNKKLAVESKTPGRTQLINMFKCEDKEGDIGIFVDLPGYGFAKISKTQQDEISFFLQEYITQRGSLRTVFVLVDIRRDPQELDRAMINFLEEEGIDCVVIATKIDKMSSKNELQNALNLLRKEYKLPKGQPIPFSSITGEGRKEVWRSMRDGITGEGEDEQAETQIAEEIPKSKVPKPVGEKDKKFEIEDLF